MWIINGRACEHCWNAILKSNDLWFFHITKDFANNIRDEISHLHSLSHFHRICFHHTQYALKAHAIMYTRRSATSFFFFSGALAQNMSYERLNVFLYCRVHAIASAIVVVVAGDDFPFEYTFQLRVRLDLCQLHLSALSMFLKEFLHRFS